MNTHNLLCGGKGWLFIGVVCLVMVPTLLNAQESCGDLVEYFSSEGEEYRMPIDDCANPFGLVDGERFSNVELSIDGDRLTDGVELAFDSLPTTLSPVATFDGDTLFTSASFTLYYHDGEDYRTDYSFTANATGTYTLVHTIEELPQQVFAPIQWLHNLFVTTAHAQFGGFAIHERTAVTFTVALAEPEPAGAPSVLFLPGIQASRLYKDGLLGSEDQLWTPTNAYSQDVRQLAMTDDGISINDVYTRDVLDTAPGVGTVYGEFIAYMESLESEGVISAFKPFAYDWRYTPGHIVDRGTSYEIGSVDLIKVFDVLVEQASGGGVVIVGHSNGGLVAKALVAELEKRGKADDITDIVFIGTPHVGTPKAIGTVLHGYDQSATVLGIPIISADVARKVINNLPGVYGLLPTPSYFTGLSDSIIEIEDTPRTAELFAAYGSSIATYQGLVDFMSGQSDSLDRELSNTISTPTTINRALHTKAVTEHIDLLDDWVAPENVQVTQLVGVGLPTMKSISYREVTETKCIPAGPGNTVCGINTLLRPFALLSRDGDETVMSRSARAYAGDSEVYYVDMEKAQEADAPSLSHVNFTEANEIQQLLRNLLEDKTQSYDYLFAQKPSFDTEYDIEIIDSPVTMSAVDESGNVTGVVEESGESVIKTAIPGSNYFEFAGSKYLVIPSQTSRTTTLRGEENGGYTLTLSTLDTADQMHINSQLINATVTPNMVVTYTKQSSGYSNIMTDIDGDGEVDSVTTVTGEVVIDPPPEPEPVATYAVLREQIAGLDLPRRADRQLARLLKRAERAAKRADKKSVFRRIERFYLSAINRTLRYYQRIDVIEKAERKVISATIKEIRKN